MLVFEIAGGILLAVLVLILAGKAHEMLMRRKQFGRWPYGR